MCWYQHIKTENLRALARKFSIKINVLVLMPGIKSLLTYSVCLIGLSIFLNDDLWDQGRREKFRSPGQINRGPLYSLMKKVKTTNCNNKMQVPSTHLHHFVFRPIQI